jgi:hypothetical protein
MVFGCLTQLAFSYSINQDNYSNIDLQNAIVSSNIVAYYNDTSSIKIDGKITADEYTDSLNDSLSYMTIFLTHNSSSLFIGLIAPSNGWIAVGFNEPWKGMANSDMKLGAIVNGNVSAIDTFGIKHDDPIEDTKDGGTDDILLFNGTENEEYTIFEFVLPFISLDTNHDYNFEINKTLGLFIAYSDEDDFNDGHNRHSNVLTLFIAPEIIKIPKKTNLILFLPDNAEINTSQTFELTAVLTNQTNEVPLEGYRIIFYLKTSFGELELASNMSDHNGMAKVYTSIEKGLSGVKSVIARFHGSLDYKRSFDDKNIHYNEVIDENGNESAYGIIIPALTVLGVIITLTIIWTTFLYILRIFYLIFRESAKEEE